MARHIAIRSAGLGWLVEYDANEALVFDSGAEAERSARNLAERWAEAGEATEVRVYLRDGSLAGRYCYSPSLALAG